MYEYINIYMKRGNFESAPRQVWGAANGARQACSPCWGETNNNNDLSYVFLSRLQKK